MPAHMTYAWTSYTHRWICERANLSEIDCANADYSDVQKKYKDLAPVHHHCAGNSTDCYARLYAEKFLEMNTTLTSGFAAHLYSDSLVPVHWDSYDYKSCHSVFESLVEQKIEQSENVRYTLFGREFDSSYWNITMRCPDSKGVIKTLYVDSDYMNYVVRYVAEKMNSTYSEREIRSYDLTPAIFLSVALSLSIILFLILRNKKQKIN